MDELTNLFFKKVPLKILMKISEKEKTYATEINHELKGNYSYIVRLISDFEENNLIKTYKDGRKKVIELTDKGKKWVNKINEIIDMEVEQEKVDKKIDKKIIEFEQTLEKISEEELKNKESISKKESARIGKRLGPYKRELNKLRKKRVDKKRKEKIESLVNKINRLMEKKSEMEED